MRFGAVAIRIQKPPLLRGGTYNAVLATVLVLFAASVAALSAHVIIDMLGDVLLGRDAYDFEPHASRSIVLYAALLGGLALVGRLTANAFADVRTGSRLLRAVAQRVIAGPAWWFIARVSLATVGILALMGALDTTLDGVRLDDVADLLGGSGVLGLGVSIPLGAGIGAFALCVARWIAASHRRIVAAVSAFVALTFHVRETLVKQQPRDRVYTLRRSYLALARAAGLRAPPAARRLIYDPKGTSRHANF